MQRHTRATFLSQHKNLCLLGVFTKQGTSHQISPVSCLVIRRVTVFALLNINSIFRLPSQHKTGQKGQKAPHILLTAIGL